MSHWLAENGPWLKSADRWRPAKNECLRLRAHMASPSSWDKWHAITIEGALQYAVVVRETGRIPDDVFAGCNEFVRIMIPIERTKMRGFFIHHASHAQPSDDIELTTRMRRKKTRRDAFGGSSKILLAGGEFKELNMPVPTATVSYLDFFVLGDRAKLADLLCDVSNLGRDRARGVGLIAGWEILTEDEDRSFVYKQRPMRTLPVADEHEAAITYEHGSYDLREATVMAPYWHQHTKTLAVVPC